MFLWSLIVSATVLKMGLGEVEEHHTPFIKWRQEERNTRREEKKMFEQFVYVESWFLHGVFHQRIFSIATWSTWCMRVERRPSEITGTVGVVETWESGFSATGICFHSAVCELGNQKKFTPFLINKLLLVVAQTHRVNLQKGDIMFSYSFSLYACYYFSSSLFAYWRQMAMLASWVERTQTRTIYFLWGEKLTSAKKSSEKKSALRKYLPVSPQAANGFDWQASSNM